MNQSQKGTFSGYTVIELMVAVGIVAVLASIAVPSYTEFVEKRRITGAADEITAVMMLARGAAVKHNQQTTVSFKQEDNGDWCMGVVLGSDACECTNTTISDDDYCALKYTDDSGTAVVEPHVLSNDEYSDVAMIAATTGSGDSKLSFDPVRGVLADLSDIASFTIRSTSNTAYQLKIDISATGTVKTCTNGLPLMGMKSC